MIQATFELYIDILNVLAVKGALGVRDLASALGKTQETVLTGLFFLSKQGFVSKYANGTFKIEQKGFLVLNYFGLTQKASC